MIEFKHRGDFKSIEKFLSGASKIDYRKILDSYGREGVRALALATPVDSGLTASSWGYQIYTSKGFAKISWTNSNVVDGVPVAILLQYGHATKSGSYIEGRDYINPALQGIFDKLAVEAWKETTKL